MMRECHMQMSGPWPPYHFVHRLTRPTHAPQPAAEAAATPQAITPISAVEPVVVPFAVLAEVPAI
jgi:hypothetical protein